MAQVLLALYLIVVGLSILFGLALPAWVIGCLALIAGVLLLANCVGITIQRKPELKR